ncbi:MULTISPECIES: glutathione binding-like protein [unclassified Beijerinckia]|uniref:glutathione binding-like protein n=1 Tax=unclassified Beijerinckia TaxID=2638183 RepID=UPI0008977C9C|nr:MULTISPECIES: glutathione binding-like protein [unclassified Beijerinckia]MDH7794081.1 glutathione S-transferase [Beijerinckia sp. GAS462]SEB52912.1 glutathione S-transferase [Beijerinckia sp. 28-YEA-48]
MKLYYSPGACSLADHIALQEAGLPFESERVDLKAKKTASGADYNAISPKGYVPALALDDGALLTENVAVLDYIAQQAPALGLEGPLGRTRLLEMLAFISSEVHKSFKPFFRNGSDEEKAQASEIINRRAKYIVDNMKGNYLFGDKLSVADCYLFIITLWAEKVGVQLPEALQAFRDRMKARPAVQAVFKSEGLA